MTDGRFAISLHILTLLARSEGKYLSSDDIAGSVNINPVLVRKEMSNLKKAGLILSKEGRKGGSQLARPASQILLAEVYQSVKKESLLGWPRNNPNAHCPVGCKMFNHLQQMYDEVEETLLEKLSGMNLAEFYSQFQ
ncbi:MAG TPA: Rrf2 family transcriptional regulator [Chitinophagaceae bacterium]|nr:Rrf2 family transcriptional regulator [Chitinophagaceae bacterium]